MGHLIHVHTQTQIPHVCEFIRLVSLQESKLLNSTTHNSMSIRGSNLRLLARPWDTLQIQISLQAFKEKTHYFRSLKEMCNKILKDKDIKGYNLLHVLWREMLNK